MSFQTLSPCKRGVNYVGLCPFHSDKTPSFYVSPAKGLCKCFACGKGGNAVHFIMEHEQMSYPEALKYLAKKYGIEIKESELIQRREASTERTGKPSSLWNNFARDYFQNILKEPRGRRTQHRYGLISATAASGMTSSRSSSWAIVPRATMPLPRKL